MDEFQYKLYLEAIRQATSNNKVLSLIRKIDKVLQPMALPAQVISTGESLKKFNRAYHVFIQSIIKMKYQEDIPDYILVFADQLHIDLRTYLQYERVNMLKPQRHTATYSRQTYSRFGEVIEHWMDGYSIQCSDKGTFIDIDSGHIDFVFKPNIDYRIKPKDC